MFIYPRSSADSLDIDCWQEEEVQQNVVCLWGGVCFKYLHVDVDVPYFFPSIFQGRQDNGHQVWWMTLIMIHATIKEFWRPLRLFFYFKTTNVSCIEHIECKCTQISKYTPEICMLFVHSSMSGEWKCGIYTLKLYSAMKKEKVCR